MNRSLLLRPLIVAALATSGVPWVALPCAAAESVPQHEVLDLDEAAALLRVSPEIVRTLSEAQRMPARRVGDMWRFSRAALLDWLKGEPTAGTYSVSPAPGAVNRAELDARELPATRARGTEVSPRLAQADPAATREASSPPPPTVGERPATSTAEEIALRDQRILLKRGATTLDFGLAYSYGEQTLFPVVRAEQRTLGASATVRYGLFDDLQFTLRVPEVWRRTSTFTDATNAASDSPRTTREHYVADASLSLLGVAMREAAGRPNVILSLDGVAPSGPGDRGVGGGLVLSKSFDPAVIFAGLSYLHGFSVDPGNTRRSLAKHNVGLSLGYTYAVNDSLALSTLFAGTYRSSNSVDGISIPPSRERHQLQFGMTWMVARGVFVEPAVAMRLGGANPDFTFSLNIPYSF